MTEVRQINTFLCTDFASKTTMSGRADGDKEKNCFRLDGCSRLTPPMPRETRAQISCASELPQIYSTLPEVERLEVHVKEVYPY